MLEPNRPIVICRSAVAPERIEPTNTLGYSCVLCGKPLQVTDPGLAQIIGLQAQPVCNKCGCLLMEELRKGPPIPTEIRISPTAVEQIERDTGKCVLDTFPNATVEFE
jgi:hypothetical protein